MASVKNKKAARNFFISILPYFITFSLFEVIGAYLTGLSISDVGSSNISTINFFKITFFGMLGSLLAVWLFRKFLDKKDFKGIGFTNTNILKEVMLGLLFGFVIMIAGFYILKITGQISVESALFSLKETILSMGTFIFVAISEEAYFRGYALNNLMESYGKYIGLFISALFFAIVHSLNPDFSIWSFIGILIAGIFLGASYIFTKSLWFPIALHFSWNFFQSIFGFNVSGIDTYSLYNIHYHTENIWNGGRFGFESSLLGYLFQIIAIYFVFHIFNTKKSSENYNL